MNPFRKQSDTTWFHEFHLVCRPKYSCWLPARKAKDSTWASALDTLTRMIAAHLGVQEASQAENADWLAIRRHRFLHRRSPGARQP